LGLGERITKLREEKKLTQEELAPKIGITRAALSHYEKNRREPDNDTLRKLADFFDVTTDYLLARSNFRTPDYTEAAHRSDDPTTELPEAARKSIEDFKRFIFEKYGIKYD
jgi:Predicted transcriptional regulators